MVLYLLPINSVILIIIPARLMMRRSLITVSSPDQNTSFGGTAPGADDENCGNRRLAQVGLEVTISLCLSLNGLERKAERGNRKFWFAIAPVFLSLMWMKVKLLLPNTHLVARAARRTAIDQCIGFSPRVGVVLVRSALWNAYSYIIDSYKRHNVLITSQSFVWSIISGTWEPEGLKQKSPHHDFTYYGQIGSDSTTELYV